MARPLRIEYEGAFYHITARGNERRRIYFGKADYEKFLSYLRNAQEKYGYLLHCYVLMGNHYHLLIETPQGNMSKLMHFINSSYTTYINRKRKRSGHLFQGRYKAILIDRDSYLLELSRYLHLNPVRANIVTKPEDYPYSSYRSYISKSNETLVSRELILEMVSANTQTAPKHYQAFVENTTTQQLEDPFTKVYAGAILGGLAFITQALSRLQDGILHREEISHRTQLQARYTAEDIIKVICSSFTLSSDQMIKTREHRNMALYLMKQLTSLSNRHIGDLLGGLSAAAVAKTYQRFSEKMAKERSVRKRVEAIRAQLSRVKG
jgi:REP element-mobilizing transposase RayT